MSYRGRGGGGGRGFGRGGRGGRGRGGGGYQQDLGPPEHVVEVGTYLHPCENDLVCKSSIARVPYFNAPIYLENKSQVGKIDEIFGPFNEFMFSVKLSSDMLATSFSASQKLYIDPMKLLPLSRFLPQPKGATCRVEKRGGRGGGRGGRGRGGGGGFRGGGRGGFRGGRGGGGFRGGRGGGRGGFRGRGRY